MSNAGRGNCCGHDTKGPRLMEEEERRHPVVLFVNVVTHREGLPVCRADKPPCLRLGPLGLRPVPFEFFKECRAGNSEFLRRYRPVSFQFFKGAEDVLSFEVLQGKIQ